jgi:hypothetical protein
MLHHFRKWKFLRTLFGLLFLIGILLLSAHAHPQFSSEKKDASCSICQLAASNTLKVLVTSNPIRFGNNQFFAELKIEENFYINIDVPFTSIIRGPPFLT